MSFYDLVKITISITITSFKRSINPPLKLFDVTLQQTNVDAGAGQIITSNYHSVISIPPNAFVDKDGKTFSGNVSVQYREFYNYVDFFLSGIPMNYDSGNADLQLESAGMFELTAFNGDETLFVNQSNKITVMMASLKNTPDYNLYYFDKQQNKWIYKGNSAVTLDDQGAQKFLNSPGQEDSVEKIFTYTPPTYCMRMSCMMEPAPKRKFLRFKRPATENFRFHLIGLQKSIPELNSLSRYTWDYTGSDARAVYRTLFGKNNNIQLLSCGLNDINIVHIDADDTYTFTLRDDGDNLNINFRPRLSSGSARKKFASRFEAYKEFRDQRRKKEAEAYRKFSDDTTKYFAENPHFVKRNQSMESYAMRQFAIDGFGIWNCDRPMKIPNATIVKAYFVDQDDNRINPVQVYLADKAFNTVYNYDSQSLNKFKFNPDASNLVWAIFPGEVCVVIKTKEFREKYSKSKWVCKFQVPLNKNAVLSEDELKKQLVFDI